VVRDTGSIGSTSRVFAVKMRIRKVCAYGSWYVGSALGCICSLDDADAVNADNGRQSLVVTANR